MDAVADPQIWLGRQGLRAAERSGRSGVLMASNLGTSAMPTAATTEDAPKPQLDIDIDKVGFIIVKAREFDEKVADSDPDEGSNPTDDDNADILEDKMGDGTREELAGALKGLNEAEQIRLGALAGLPP